MIFLNVRMSQMSHETYTYSKRLFTLYMLIYRVTCVFSDSSTNDSTSAQTLWMYLLIISTEGNGLVFITWRRVKQLL